MREGNMVLLSERSHAPSSATLQDAVLTPLEEKRLAKSLSPDIAWPTLVMAVLLPTVHWTVVGLGLARILPLWVCALILTPLSYAHYTLVHESIHGNLAPGHSQLRWLNTLVGWVGALGLGFNWPMMMRGHALHHAHTNSHDDPDIEVKGSFGHLLVYWFVTVVVVFAIPLLVFRVVAPLQYRRAASMLRGSEPWQASAVASLTLVLLVLAIAANRWLDWLCLLFLPTRLAGLILAIFFQWLPHYPFDRTERYLNTRISLWPGAALLTLQQNLHLVHHLWPSVPFYNYARFYGALRPTLIAKGSRIEGLKVGGYACDPVQSSLPKVITHVAKDPTCGHQTVSLSGRI